MKKINKFNLPLGSIPDFNDGFKINNKLPKKASGILHSLNAHINDITDEMSYEDLSVFLKRELDLKTHFLCPVIVRVKNEKGDRVKEILAAFEHLE